MTNPGPVVAIVDDDPRMLESLEDLLESEGYVARIYASASAFLAGGLSGFDVLITDIGMPGTDGFALRDIVQRSRPNLPVFLITGRHELIGDERVQGADGLFRKPFDARQLLDAIRDALSSRALEE